MARVERAAEVLVRAEPAELVANATRVLLQMQEKLTPTERLQASLKLTGDSQGTLAAVFLEMDKDSRVALIRGLLN